MVVEQCGVHSGSQLLWLRASENRFFKIDCSRQYTPDISFALLKSGIYKTIAAEVNMNSDVTLDITEVATMLRADPETIMRLARTGELPAAHIGKSWVFLRDDVISYLKERILKETTGRRDRNASQTPLAISFPVQRASRRTVLPRLPELLPNTTKSPKPSG
jgi:excisionase family DNA binding protein